MTDTCRSVVKQLTGHLADSPTRGFANSRICQLADCQLTDWTSRGLVNSRSSQLADWTTRALADSAKRTKAEHAKSPVASASCPVRDLSRPRVGNLRVVQSPMCIAHYGVCRHRPSGMGLYKARTGHAGCTGRILYTWLYYRPSNRPSNCPKC